MKWGVPFLLQKGPRELAQLQDLHSKPVWGYRKTLRRSLTGWKKLACAPNERSLKQVSKLPVLTLEWSCWKQRQERPQDRLALSLTLH